MTSTTVTRTIQAPVERVFDAVAHIESFSEIVPDITRIEFLGEQRRGVGSRFRETRRMGKREATTELEVTEYVPNEHVRLVADEGGTLWDTIFTTRPRDDGAVELKLVMEARPHRLLARIVTPLIRGVVQRAIEKDMDAIQRHCEQ